MLQSLEFVEKPFDCDPEPVSRTLFQTACLQTSTWKLLEGPTFGIQTQLEVPNFRSTWLSEFLTVEAPESEVLTLAAQTLSI